MVGDITMHFDSLFVNFEKLIRSHPGPLWGGREREFGQCPTKNILFFQELFPYRHHCHFETGHHIIQINEQTRLLNYDPEGWPIVTEERFNATAYFDQQ